MNLVEFSTNSVKACVSSESEMAINPSNSALVPCGLRYGSTKPKILSTRGALSLTQMRCESR
jgi:hypothetical protein